MISKKISAYNSIAYMVVACQFLQWVGHPLGLSQLVSLSVSLLSVITVFAFFVLCLDKTGTTYKTNDLTYLLLTVALVSLCASITHPMNIALVKKLLVFFQLPILLVVAKRTANKSSRDLIYTINMLYPILCLYYYIAPFAHRYVSAYGVIFIDALTLGFANPNDAAIYLMICAFLLLAAMFRYKHWLTRTLLLAEFVWMVFLIYKTDCRAVVFLLGAVIVGTLFWRNLKVTASLIKIVFIGAALFLVLLYLLPAVQSLTFMGESFDTGRANIFSDYANRLSLGNFLIGDFQYYSLSNTHNAFLSILASFGIMSALAIWCFFYRAFKYICVRVPKSKEHKVLLLSCLAIILHSAVEAALLVHGVVYATFVFLILFMTSGCDAEEAEQ